MLQFDASAQDGSGTDMRIKDVEIAHPVRARLFRLHMLRPSFKDVHIVLSRSFFNIYLFN